MKLRDHLDWNGNSADLTKFLEEPFEINHIDDFRFIAIIPYKISVKQREILEGLDFPEERKEELKYCLGYDYTSEYKIFLKHFHHKLKKENVPKEYFENLDNICKGIFFKMEGSPLEEQISYFGRDSLGQIWPEFNDYPQIEKDYCSSIKYMEESLESKEIYPLVNKEKWNLIKLSGGFFRFFDYKEINSWIRKKRNDMLPLGAISMHNIKHSLQFIEHYLSKS